MTAARGSRREQTGFTLLELLVAITLMGLVLVLLYSGLRLGLNGWDSGEARAEATNRLRLAEEFLRRQLAQSMTVRRINDRQEPVVVFTGEASRIEFVAPMLAQLGQGGLYRVRIEGGDGRLWIRWRPYLPADPNAGQDRETVLLEGVSGVEWAYFGAERDDDPHPQWRSQWTSPTRRPLLVRLNLILQGQPWPDLVVALSEGPP
jgi:general secretion pathway protein J